jgi:hypothetical protein
MKILSFLIYTILFETLVLGGCGYVVFHLHESGWWFILAVLCSILQIKPEGWSKLWDNKI